MAMTAPLGFELSALLKCCGIDLWHVCGEENKQIGEIEGRTDAAQPDDSAAWQFR